jgi:lauroyl/myristoyl acyltransferase
VVTVELYFQANIHRFLPNIKKEEYQQLYKLLIYNQYLVTIDQYDFNKLDKINIHNNSSIDFTSPLPNPTIFATFHYGSYRIINSYLLKYGFKVVLIIDEHAYNTQKQKIEDSYEKLKSYANQNNSDYIILNVKESSSIFRLKELLKNGYVLIVYIDGNTGSLKGKNFNKGYMNLAFLESRINVKNGIAVLSSLLKATIIPVMTYWDKSENINMNFHNDIIVNDYSNNKIFIEGSITKIYSILEHYVKRTPEQWECWSYIHEWFKRDKLYPYKVQNTNDLKFIFNEERYSLFALKNEYYFFDKYSYRGFPLGIDTYLKIKDKNINNIEKSKLEYLITKNVII